jgi:hypothetical protein
VPVRKLARIVDDALRDESRARRVATDPQFRMAVQKDRRAELSKFKTVEHALKDRARIEASKARKKKKKG